ncbi:MAG: F0F1 ATP synthase subunit B [Gomphosphaeria aponina SAG 52.96 = DSM 107014]|uniref:ATP synthase subunit b n=1 Tax=Gomphosphaeria aponina SAG 52.96 = DSM 107014 TaxID=1521640 RepID=A0A941GV28_9CHRO|nr:F0F1 ATP synthase subunit B [Gomphosphaeria aponina SAG 52.96 = DSM 107014]
MGNFLYLATEAAAESGFGLNFDILETNIINLGIIIVLLVVYGGKVIGKILTERRSKIEAEIKEAEERAASGAAALADAQQNLAQAQAQAEKIKAEAETTALKVKEEILAEGKKEVARIKSTAVKELDAQRAKAIAQLKQRIGFLAIERVESQLKERLDASAQEKLVNRCIAQLGGGS